MTNTLILLSTHGTYNTTHKEVSGLSLKKLFMDNCDAIYQKINTLHSNDNIYIGYDGDSIQGDIVPPTLLLCMLIEKFKDNKPIIMQSQGTSWGNPHSFKVISNYLKFNNDFDDYFDEKESVYDALEQQQNITLVYTTKNKDELPDDKLKELITKLKSESRVEHIKLADDALGAYEGKYGGLNNGKLAGSTAAWHIFLKEQEPKFDNVYYTPIWDDSLVKAHPKTGIKNYYKTSITNFIKEAIKKNIFTNDNKPIKILSGKYVTSGNNETFRLLNNKDMFGGGKKRKGKSKRKTTFRKSSGKKAFRKSKNKTKRKSSGKTAFRKTKNKRKKSNTH